jgi:hypothetical protein
MSFSHLYSSRPPVLMLAIAALSTLPLKGQPMETTPDCLPVLRLPDEKITEVYRENWLKTLLPCREDEPRPVEGEPAPHVEPGRPWRVDVSGHYPGWYPGVDVKHSAAAYLACEKNLDVVLRAWDLTRDRYLLADGSLRPMTFYNNPHSVVPETTLEGGVVYYPLRLTGNIDFLLLGDLLYRYSRDKQWLAENLPALRAAAAHIASWIDPQGLLHSDSYDLDQVFRQIDGVAQTSACFAFRCLAKLEEAVGNQEGYESAERVAARLAEGFETHFWQEELGYYAEHLVYSNLAREGKIGSIEAVSSELDEDHSGEKAVDGVWGIGIDAFQVGTGAAGQHEWASKGETQGAFIRVRLARATRIGGAILFNRTAPGLQPSERFASGTLTFSDGSDPVEVVFNSNDISRGAVSFSPREVEWVQFNGHRMQGEGGGNAGLAEFLILPADQPYLKINHGMTDTNYAAVGFGIACPERAERVWHYFKSRESSFYRVGDLSAPTWIAEKAETYGPHELNKRAPYKDCVAMARIWRYDALMRHRMGDGEGLYRTLCHAHALVDRPSGGGSGFFAERYALGRFQPGDEAQATVEKYAEYPAVYNSTIVQQTLLGLEVDHEGTVTVAPCVPEDWYRQGFGADGCGLLKDRDLGFNYFEDRIEGWVSGSPGNQRIEMRLPPHWGEKPLVVLHNGQTVEHLRKQDRVEFALKIETTQRTDFAIQRED